ncbi:MAG: hypothetical protein CL947_03165 [Epsilonproteobacteria bacterium]|nr:hypothetical protein [Campylobacterota bacterium]|tara:strand:- start:1897 stop:2100 length:204 start_codon:yes stop_codon:yes gene_type:complete
MNEKKRNELHKLCILLIVILLFTNGEIAIKIQKSVLATVTWEQIILGAITLRIIYILLQEFVFGNKK